MARCASKFGSLEMAISDVVTTMVVPAGTAGDWEKSEQENAERCELSGLDLQPPDMYVPLLLLFDAPATSWPRSGLQLAGLVEELKQSLAKVLVAFYPLAGRIVQKPGGQPQLVCNNAGVVFTSAHVDAPMSRVVYSGGSGAVGMSDFQPVPEISGISTAQAWLENFGIADSADPQEVKEVEKPALMVQVTGFECGGVALAVNWLHQVADGFAVSQFLKAWSAACANSGGLGLGLMEPDHGRAQSLKKAHFLDGAFSDQDLAADYTPPGLERVVWTRDMAAAAQALAAVAPALHTPIVRLVHYTEAGIRKLKALTRATAQDFSTFTCVSAHLWQCVTRARLQLIREAQAQAQAEGAEGDGCAAGGTCIFIAAADAKVRRTGLFGSSASTSPEPGYSDESATLLPASYFGNSVLGAQTRELEPEELVRQPLGFAASLIKESVAGIHLRAYQYVLALSAKYGARNISMMPRGAAHDFVTSSWYRFPLYDLPFCFSARPVLAVCNLTPAPLMDGWTILLPSPLGPNNLTAMLIANASVIDNLCLDPQFLDYAY